MKKKLVSALLSVTMVTGMLAGTTAFADTPDELDVIYLSCSTASEFWQYIGAGIQNAVRTSIITMDGVPIRHGLLIRR